MVDLPKEGGSLHSRTWDIDHREGQVVNDLILASAEPIQAESIEVPDDLNLLRSDFILVARPW